MLGIWYYCDGLRWRYESLAKVGLTGKKEAGRLGKKWPKNCKKHVKGRYGVNTTRRRKNERRRSKRRRKISVSCDYKWRLPCTKWTGDWQFSSDINVEYSDKISVYTGQQLLVNKQTLMYWFKCTAVQHYLFTSCLVGYGKTTLNYTFIQQLLTCTLTCVNRPTEKRP